MGLFDFLKPKPKTEYDIKKENEAGFHSAENDYWEAVRLMNAGQGKKAFDLYVKCAQKNHKRAQYMVGACYEDGIGVEKDYDKAFEWYTRTISDRHNGTFYYHRDNVAGYTWAKYRLGLLHMWGLGTPQSKPMAEEIFVRLSELREGKRFDCEKEVAFLACRELYANYSKGSNNFPQSYTPAHRWALKTLDAYNFAVKYDTEESREFKRKYGQEHHWALQFVAYNLENGRGVDKNLEEGTEYRRKAAEIYKDGDDAYWAGRGYEQLDNRETAKGMYRFATKQDNEEYRKRANDRLAEMAKEEADSIANLLDRLKKSPTAEDHLYAAQLYLNKKAWLYDPKLKKHLNVETKINMPLGLAYVLGVIMLDVKDKTPLPGDFIEPEAVDKLNTSRQQHLEDYVRARFREKSGKNFSNTILIYRLNSFSTHTESLFRVSQLASMLDGSAFDDRIIKNTSRPIYNTLTEPTLALVRKAQGLDPEAVMDLARIYRKKGRRQIEELLLKVARIIYKRRMASGEPEAMYRYAALQAYVRQANYISLVEESPYYYMFSAFANGYSLPAADFSHERFTSYIDADMQNQMRQIADKNGVKQDCYIDYFAPDEINEAMKKAASDHEENMSLPADDRYFYFNRVNEFMLSKTPFNSPEMHRLIDEGVFDKLYDKEMTDLIKELAYTGNGLESVQITEEVRDDVMKGFREIYLE